MNMPRAKKRFILRGGAGRNGEGDGEEAGREEAGMCRGRGRREGGHEGAGRVVRNGARGAEEESGGDRRWMGVAGRGGGYVCTYGTRYDMWMDLRACVGLWICAVGCGWVLVVVSGPTSSRIQTKVRKYV